MVYSINDAGNIGQICGKKKKKELHHELIPIIRINSKWIKDLNVRLQTTHIIEENTGSKILDIAPANIYSDILPQASEIKGKTIQWDYIKVKSVCTVKETNKMKRQPTEWETIFTDTSDMGLIPNIYKELLKLNTNKTNNPIKKRAKDLNRHFPEEDIQMANTHMKRCSTSLIIR